MPMGTVRDRLRIVLDIANDITRLAANRTFEDAAANRDVMAAIERYVERLSAVLGHVPDAFKIEHPEVEWRDIGGMGNLLRHVYDRDLESGVWRVATGLVPPLKRAVEIAIAEATSPAPR